MPTRSLPHRLSRRLALRGLAALSAASSLSALSPRLSAAQTTQNNDQQGDNDDRDDRGNPLPNPDQSGIEHIVVVMMENRSFDHILGWLPGHDGRQAGLAYTDASGESHRTHALAPDFQGCAFHDPDHSFAGGRVEYDNGKCDGFLRAGDNDLYSIGYYRREDLPFFGTVAPRFVTPPRYFPAILGPTFPNRIFQHAGETDRLSNTLVLSTLPTIWDRLAAKGISARYYFSDIPVVALWGNKYLPIAQPVTSFLRDAAAGTLPAVAYIDPGFSGEATGTTNDDHPFNDLRNGQFFLDTLYRAVTQGPGWRNTVFIINYDEWGGFFEHVPPPPGAVTAAEQALGYTDGLRGFRVPCLVISPWTQHPYLAATVFDHTSILKLIEWRYGLDPLSVRDAQANNLAQVMEFDRPRYDVPQANVAPGPYGSPCVPSAAATALAAPVAPPAPGHTHDDAMFEWLPLRDFARTHGWTV
jgi:phospholipase C